MDPRPLKGSGVSETRLKPSVLLDSRIRDPYFRSQRGITALTHLVVHRIWQTRRCAPTLAGMSMDTHKQLVQARFGPNAAEYAVSTNHAKGNSLARLVELARPQAHWHVLDVATGAGHTALALAPHVAEVVASDLTPQMLDAASQLACERGVTNLRTQLADAEALPFEASSFDLVTSRIAPHHFANIPQFLAEVARVLKPGGRLIIVDNIAPEDAAADLDAFEQMRDPSHVHCLSPREWAQGMVGAGLALLHGETMAKVRPFNVWASHQHTPSVLMYELANYLRQTSAPAKAFLAPVFNPDGSGALFTLTEGIFVAQKGSGPKPDALAAFLHVWEMDPAQSAYELGQPPQQGTYDLQAAADAADAVDVQMRWRTAQGQPGQMSYRFVADGQSYPMDNPAVDATTTTLIDDHLLATAAYKAGRLLSYGIRELSEDGRTLYINQIAFGADGLWSNNRSVYVRQS